MTKIDIFSGFLGAGKTTLIRKLIKEAYNNEQIVLVENEFGEIAIDGGFLKDAGVQITEMNSGCICCTLVGDFKAALEEVIEKYNPDRVIIEPSGVGKLSDVSKAVMSVADKAEMGAKVTVVDANKCKMYIKNFGEFFNDQVSCADVIVLSRTGDIKESKLIETTNMLKELNPEAVVVTTPWEKVTGQQFIEAMEHRSTLAQQLAEMEEEHHHHHHEDGEECCCGHHHDDEEEEHEHHHHHEDGEECCCGHHHDDEDEEHEHHHHHHHHADDVFSSWGEETPKKYSEDQLKKILEEIQNTEKYGMVLRAKGMLNTEADKWLYFDYVPGEINIRDGEPMITGRFCVIGSKINEQAIKELFEVE